MSYFNEESKLSIKEAIERAEKQTSGEICVFLDKRCKTDPFEKALEHFHKLKMTETKLRNGALIYIATEDKVFAILGDQGIHEKVGQEFWDQSKAIMKEHFMMGEVTTGIVKAIDQIGEALKMYFPYEEGDVNELANDVITGDDD
ncbi:MAG TPA: TPM domain-containing protein [Saprospiraceae bacterium]|nr:TPM domain-containing protein [Saprospiraceae bacterium]